MRICYSKSTLLPWWHRRIVGDCFIFKVKDKGAVNRCPRGRLLDELTTNAINSLPIIKVFWIADARYQTVDGSNFSRGTKGTSLKWLQCSYRCTRCSTPIVESCLLHFRAANVFRSFRNRPFVSATPTSRGWAAVEAFCAHWPAAFRSYSILRPWIRTPRIDTPVTAALLSHCFLVSRPYALLVGTCWERVSSVYEFADVRHFGR